MSHKEESTLEGVPNILFYCKDCQQVVVDPKREGQKYVYTCPICKGKQVSFGTKKAVTDYFHIKEVHLKQALESAKKLA